MCRWTFSWLIVLKRKTDVNEKKILSWLQRRSNKMSQELKWTAVDSASEDNWSKKESIGLSKFKTNLENFQKAQRFEKWYCNLCEGRVQKTILTKLKCSDPYLWLRFLWLNPGEDTTPAKTPETKIWKRLFIVALGRRLKLLQKI